MQKMSSNGLAGGDFYYLKANFQNPNIPRFPIQFEKNHKIVPDVKMKEFDFWPDPPPLPP